MKIEQWKLRTALVLVAISSAAYAALPYTFQAGQPARASEVNANFKNLDDRVAAIESAGASGNGGGAQTPPHQLTYTPVAAVPGDEFVVGGTTFRVIKVPVKTPDGSIFAVTYPKALSQYKPTSSTTQNYYRATLSVAHQKYAIQSNASIGGYAANLSVSDYWSFAYGARFSQNASNISGYWDNEAAVSQNASGNVSIDVGPSVISLYFSATEEQLSTTGISASTSDYTNSVDLTPVNDSAALIAQVDKWVDYVKVERL